MMIRRLFPAACAALAVTLGACGSDDTTTTDTSAITSTTGSDEPGSATTATTAVTPTSAPATPDTSTPDTSTPEGPVDFDVYLQAADVGPDCDQVVGVPSVSTVEGPEADALAQLLAGPTPEQEAQGLGSWFSADTAGMLRSVDIEDRVARVDFDPALATTIPNASSSCGSASLLAQLDATIEQFDSVDRAVYSLGGDVDAFYEWLQLAAPDQ